MLLAYNAIPALSYRYKGVPEQLSAWPGSFLWLVSLLCLQVVLVLCPSGYPHSPI